MLDNPVNFTDPTGLYTALGDDRFRREVDDAFDIIRRGLGEGCCSYFHEHDVDLHGWALPGGPPYIHQDDGRRFSGQQNVCAFPVASTLYVFVNWPGCFATPNPCKLASVLLHELGHLARRDVGHDYEPSDFFKICNLGCADPGRFQ